MTGKLDRKYVNILGTKIDSTTMQEVLTTIGLFLQSQDKFSLFTPNPEILLEAGYDQNYRDILNNSNINIPDGVGIKFAAKFLYKKDIEVMPGRKLFEEIVKKASESNWKLFLLGGLGNEAEDSSKVLLRKYNNLKIETSMGPLLNKSGEPTDHKQAQIERESIYKINKFKPDILFVAYGAPKQEKWIAKHLKELNCGGAMAVGGTFSYISGKSKLPPSWMERGGLEWLWRLVCEPRRVLRILNAVLVFPVKVFLYKFQERV